MEVKILRATPEDVSVLIDVYNQSFLSDYQKYGVCPGYNRTREQMLESITKKRIYKMVVGDEVAGAVSVRVEGEHKYHLNTLCVIPKFENQGIGQQTMAFLDKEFADARYWSLETPTDKLRNHYFYKKHGYQVLREYQDGPVGITLFERHI